MPAFETSHVGDREVWIARGVAVVAFVGIAVGFATLVAGNPTAALATMGGGAAFLTYVIYAGVLKLWDALLGRWRRGEVAEPG